MKNKVIFLVCFVTCMLLLIESGKAQNQVVLPDDKEEVIIIQEDDENINNNDQPPTPIQVSYRTWCNLEKNLRDEVIRLSNDQCRARTISNEQVGWAYLISDIPTVDGKETVYLLVLKNKEGCLISLNNPNEKDVLTEYCIKLATPSKHQTDDPVFGQPVSNGNDREIKSVNF